MPQLKFGSRPARGTQVARPTNVAMREQRANLARELVETLLFIALVFLIMHVTVQTYNMPDLSMSPTVQSGQYILVNTQAFLLGGPSRGDVVVVDDPANPSQQMVRRVVGLPNETIEMSATQVLINGKPLNEPYISVQPGQVSNGYLVAPKHLGPNQYFVLEDNRGAVDLTTKSPADSRTFGVVPRGDIVGKVVLVFWPLHDVHWVASIPATLPQHDALAHIAG